MKKNIAIVALALGLTVAASAQSRSIGLRGGAGAQFSFVTNDTRMGGDFMEYEVGLNGFGKNMDLQVSALTNNIFWNNGGFNAYWGYGALAGIQLGDYTGFNAAAAAQLGIMYTFNVVPFNISLDVRPAIGITVGDGADLYYTGMYPALGFRFVF